MLMLLFRKRITFFSFNSWISGITMLSHQWLDAKLMHLLLQEISKLLAAILLNKLEIHLNWICLPSICLSFAALMMAQSQGGASLASTASTAILEAIAQHFTTMHNLLCTLFTTSIHSNGFTVAFWGLMRSQRPRLLTASHTGLFQSLAKEERTVSHFVLAASQIEVLIVF